MGANCKRQGSLSAGRVWGFPFHEGETDLVSKQTVLNLTMPASGWPMGEKYFKMMNIFSSSFLFHAVYALYMMSVPVCVVCVCVWPVCVWPVCVCVCNALASLWKWVWRPTTNVGIILLLFYLFSEAGSLHHPWSALIWLISVASLLWRFCLHLPVLELQMRCHNSQHVYWWWGSEHNSPHLPGKHFKHWAFSPGLQLKAG